MNPVQYCIRRTGLEVQSSGRSLITIEQREEPGMKSTYRELAATHGLALNDTIITSGCELAMRQMFNHLSGASFRKRGCAPEGFGSLEAYRRYMTIALGVPAWVGELQVRRFEDGRVVCSYLFAGDGPAATGLALNVPWAA